MVAETRDPVARRWRRIGTGLLVVAAVAAYLALRPPGTTFAFDADQLVERWNERNADPRLEIGEVQWTDREGGIFGFAFTPTLSVLARVEGPFELVGEAAVVGRPGRDGADLVTGAMEMLVAVTAPDLTAPERRRVLEELGLAGGIPVGPDQEVIRDRVRFRTAADHDRGIVGIGATPAGAPG